jgi:hypothetical protein
VIVFQDSGDDVKTCSIISTKKENKRKKKRLVQSSPQKREKKGKKKRLVQSCLLLEGLRGERQRERGYG